MKKINLLLLFLLLACTLPARMAFPSLLAEPTATQPWNFLITESAYVWNTIFQTVPWTITTDAVEKTGEMWGLHLR